MRMWIWAGILAIGLVGCSGSQPNDQMAAKMGGESAPSSPMALQQVGLKQPMVRKIIYKGDVNLSCEKLEAATSALEAMVKNLGGYVSRSANDGMRGEVRQASWTVKIPSFNFEKFMDGVRSIGELQSTHRLADDVSEEYYDAQAHLKNKLIEEQRLTDLIKRNGGKLTDVLAVEKELTRVRGEIEVIQGRLILLQSQTAFSTIEVNIREVKDFLPVGPPTFQARVGRSFNGSLTALGEFSASAALFVVALTPWVLPPCLIVLVVWGLRRRQKPSA